MSKLEKVPAKFRQFRQFRQVPTSLPADVDCLIVREKGGEVDGWASSKGVDLQLSGTWTTELHSNMERGECPLILDSMELGPPSPTQT